MTELESPVLDDNAGERMVPESAGYLTFWEHVYRYAFACQFVAGKRVLDLACGEGYGATALLKAGAADVVGVDVSESVCMHARRKYGLDARPGDAENIPLRDGSQDIVVSFETIEHVPNPDRFLVECLRVLAPGGALIVSTPNKEIYGCMQKNPYHCSEMSAEEFAAVLKSRFRGVSFYSQRPISAAWWSSRTLASENPPWRIVRGACRLRSVAQRRVCPEAMHDPSNEQRRSAVDLILKIASERPNLLNPYAVRPLTRLHREKPMYIVAIAVR